MLKRLLPRKVKMVLRSLYYEKWLNYANTSYSQEGEDLILQRLFCNKANGFYVDVGAHHPARFSNTYLFYRQGWHGINIDAMPGSMQAFNKKRPRDINLEVPVSEKPEVLTYYAFNEPALNGFSKDLSDSRNGLRDYHIIFQKELQTETLREILSRHLPSNQAIDFLSVDVEGLDFAVLRSNDWNKYRPKIVLVEILGKNLEDILHSELAMYMRERNYEIQARSMNTVFFCDTAQEGLLNHG